MEWFGKYRLEHRLDSGGRYAFFRAVHAAQPYRAALQPCVVLRSAASSEASSWPAWADPSPTHVLSHPNIVRMLEHGTLEGRRYFAFEFVDGVDLRHLLSGAGFPRNVVLYVTQALTHALSAAHDASLGPHGCVEPRWVFISRRGEVKLGGYGFAYLKPERPRALDNAILAPEQLQGGAESPQSDMFQLGLVVHQMLFACAYVSSSLARARREAGGDDTPPTQIPRVDPQLDALVATLLAERPEDRFASTLALRRQIDSIAPRRLGRAEACRWLAARVSGVA